MVLALLFIAFWGYNIIQLLEKEVRPSLSANAWLRPSTQHPGASFSSVIAEACVTPVSGRVAGAISMVPARLT